MEKQKEKPILATNIDGLLIDHSAFTEPHKYWFERAIKKTKDNSLKKWIGKENYFLGVNEAMEKIFPNASKEKRTRIAREWYQEDVIKYIKNNQEVIKKDVAKKLVSIKDRYKLILLTTNTKDYINKILNVSKLENIYDGIVASKLEEEPDKEKLINELIKEYGKPMYYLTGKLERINAHFKELGINVIYQDDITSLF